MGAREEQRQERRWGRHPVSYTAGSLRLLCEPRREAGRGPTVVHPQDEGSRASAGRPKPQGSQESAVTSMSANQVCTGVVPAASLLCIRG